MQELVENEYIEDYEEEIQPWEESFEENGTHALEGFETYDHLTNRKDQVYKDEPKQKFTI